jgi:hypothetical protein
MGMVLAGAALTLAGCAGTGGPGPDVPRGEPLPGECAAEPAQSMVGQQATAEVGPRILSLTGARQLRWGPPDSVMTMDFRPDRVTVSYDRDMRIERVACG